MGLLNWFSKKKQKRIIIGLDGVPYPMIQTFTQNGTMPGLGSIMADAQFQKMRSSIPHISSVAWSSIITGKNPGEHGIYGFMELKEGSYDFSFPDSSSIKARPFWEEEEKRRSVIINVPSTYPAHKINGVLIAGFVAIDLEKATFPPSLVSKLKGFDYRTDTDASKGHESIDLFLKDVNDTLEARIKAYRYLWDNEKWDTFMFVITGTDRLCHFLYEAYRKEDHRYRTAFIDFFRRVDEIITEIYEKVTEKDLFMILSDHGFGHLKTEVHLNRFLMQNGFLKLNGDPSESFFHAIAQGTKAFILDPSRVYIHTKEKYPRGEVDKKDREKIIKDLENAFLDFEIKGEKVIKTVYRKEDIFCGPYLDKAPDLVLIENEGFDLKAKLAAQNLHGTTVFTGKHTLDDGFLLVRPPVDTKIEIPENVTVYDVRGIMETAE